MSGLAIEEPMADLAAATRRLISVLERENAALRERCPDAVAELSAEKGDAVRAYEACLAAAHKATHAFATLADDARQALYGIARDLSAYAEENAALLCVAIAASRRVMTMVADAVRSLDPGPGTYSAKGTCAVASRRGTPKAVPISVDRAL